MYDMEVEEDISCMILGSLQLNLGEILRLPPVRKLKGKTKGNGLKP